MTIDITTGSAPPARTAAQITVRRLAKQFQGSTIYRGFDLDIARGRFVSVFGPNGCGKSTLINIIAGLIPPDHGEILFGGKTLAETKIGYVFQNYREALFPWLSSFANIEYPLKLMGVAAPARRARVEALIARLGVKIDLARYPYELSGGQQQRVAIARSLATGNPVLLADEPTGELDYRTGIQILRLLRARARGDKTVVVVTHNREISRMGDQVVELSNGRIAASGPPAGGPVDPGELRW